MPKTLEQLIRENGGTDEDVKALTANAKIKAAMEKQLADYETAAAERDAALGKSKEMEDWYYNTALPTVDTTNKKAAQLEADLAAERARIKALQDAGLLKVAGGEGAGAGAGSGAGNGAGSGAAAAAAASAAAGSAIDPSKFVPVEKFTEAFHSVGDAIAVATNVANQHRRLFNTDLDVEALLAESRKAKVPFKDYWESKFKVADKRAELAAAEQAARDKKIADDAVAAYKAAELNPATRTPSASMFPTFRKEGAQPETPWADSDARAANRVQKTLTNMQKSGVI